MAELLFIPLCFGRVGGLKGNECFARPFWLPSWEMNACTSHGGFRVVRPIVLVACALLGGFAYRQGQVCSLLGLHPVLFGARGEQPLCHRPDRDLCSLGG